MGARCYYNNKKEPANCEMCPFGDLNCIFYSDKDIPNADPKSEDRFYIMLKRFKKKNRRIWRRRGFDRKWLNGGYTKIVRDYFPDKYRAYKEQLKQEEEKEKSIEVVDFNKVLSAIVVSLGLGYIMIYIGQIFQIFTEFFFGSISLFMGTSDSWAEMSIPEEEKFFYASHWSRYAYWSSLLFFCLMWSGGHYKDGYNRKSKGVSPVFEIFSFSIFCFVAISNINLFLSTLIGPPFIILCMFLTAKR